MMKIDTVLVRYGEIGIKSDNVRSRSEQLLVKNLKSMLDFCKVSYEAIKRDFGRILIETNDATAAETAAKVFGVVSTSPAYSTSSDIAHISSLALELSSPLLSGSKTFGIRARRTGTHDYSSKEVAVIVGHAIAEATDAPIDLTSPDVELFIEVRGKKAYIYTQVCPGVGGMPLGTQGKVVALISGGIDSPVAAWMMMKRGCEIIPLFFDCGSFIGDVGKKRAIDCIRALAVWAMRPLSAVYINHETSLIAFKKSNQRMTCIFCKRMMYRIATELAVTEGAHAIVTGESIGQVASQTTFNLLAIDKAAGVPVLRPLVGMDKTEIVKYARRICSYSLSTSGGPTLCAAAPKHPITNADIEAVTKIETRLPLAELIDYEIKTTVREWVTPDTECKRVLNCFNKFK